VKTFAHHLPETLEEVFGLFAEYGESARLNAGGTDLLGVLKDDIHPAYPRALVSLKAVAGLAAFSLTEEQLTLGAMTRLSDLARLEEPDFALVREAAHSVGSAHIRAMGTVGGNLLQEVRCWYYRYPRHLGGPVGCHRKGSRTCPAVKGDHRYHAIFARGRCVAVCPSDLATVLTPLGGVAVLRRVDGERKVPVGRLYSNLGTALEPGEVMTEIRVPRPPGAARLSYRKHAVRRSLDFALVSVAALAVMDDEEKCTSARVVLGGVAPAPWEASEAGEILRGRRLDAASAALAARAALAKARPLPGSAYRVPMTEAVLREVLLGLGEASH
jgi:xanthine dehydrogenase YagS FAD-binding subunit